jgi:transaldolase
VGVPVPAHQQQRREKAECLENLKEFDEKHKKFADDGSDMMNDLDEKGIRVFAK